MTDIPAAMGAAQIGAGELARPVAPSLNAGEESSLNADGDKPPANFVDFQREMV
jgi:hypothetical protein